MTEIRRTPADAVQAGEPAGLAMAAAAPASVSAVLPVTSVTSSPGETQTAPAPPNRPRTSNRAQLARLLGPAFVAAVAYVDPGNVAANLTAGAEFGYLLIWVLVSANVMAVLVQYLSAKLGIATGQSLPSLLGARLRRPQRLAYWAQAEVVAAATDLAEIIGGAIALQLLFGIPLVIGGVISGLASLVLLMVQQRQGQRRFELVITTLLVVLTLGFCAGLLFGPPDPKAALGGLVPHFEGTRSVLLAASMLGATVMPHAIYLHSTLVVDRHGRDHDGATRRRLIIASRWDVVLALALAGSVNIAMLLLAAANLPGRVGTDTIAGAQSAISSAIGPAVGIAFGVALLASSLASTSVGAYAGAEIMRGLLHVRIPLLARRVVTLIPAIILLATGVSPTMLLVFSQVVLSFGIPFALIPLVRLTTDRSLMGTDANNPWMRAAAWATTVVIIALNMALLWLTFSG